MTDQMVNLLNQVLTEVQAVKKEVLNKVEDDERFEGIIDRLVGVEDRLDAIKDQLDAILEEFEDQENLD